MSTCHSDLEDIWNKCKQSNSMQDTITCTHNQQAHSAQTWCLTSNSRTQLDKCSRGSRRVPPPGLSHEWPSPFPSWPPSWLFHATAPKTTCANLPQNQFIHFQNTVFTSLPTDGRTRWEHNAWPGRAWSGLA